MVGSIDGVFNAGLQAKLIPNPWFQVGVRAGVVCSQLLSYSSLHPSLSSTLCVLTFQFKIHHLWQSIWAGHIHAIRGKHLSRARRKTVQQLSHQILGCSITGSCDHRIQASFFATSGYFLEHFARTRCNVLYSMNQTVRTGTLGKSR